MSKINALGHVSDVNVPQVDQEPVVDIRTGNPALDAQLTDAVWKAIKKGEQSSQQVKTS